MKETGNIKIADKRQHYTREVFSFLHFSFLANEKKQEGDSRQMRAEI